MYAGPNRMSTSKFGVCEAWCMIVWTKAVDIESSRYPRWKRPELKKYGDWENPHLAGAFMAEFLLRCIGVADVAL